MPDGRKLLACLCLPLLGFQGREPGIETGEAREEPVQTLPVEARVLPDPGGRPRLVFGLATGPGTFRPLLRLEGLRVREAGREPKPGPGFEAFTKIHRSGKTWVLRGGTPEIQAFTCRILRLSPGRFRVDFRDRIGLPVRLLDLALVYRWIAPEPPERVSTPRRCPTPEERSDDRSAGTPLLALGTGNLGIAFLPDPRTLARDRRIPRYFRIEAPAASPLCLLGAGRNRRTGDGRILPDPTRPNLLIDEDCGLRHEIWFADRGLDEDFYIRALDEVWSRGRRIRDALESSHPPSPLALPAALERSLERLFPVPGGRDALWIAPTPPTTESKRSFPPAFEAGQILDLAGDRGMELALSLWASGGEERRARASALVRTVLSAPSRGGLFPTRARVTEKGLRWIREGKGPYRTGDCARLSLLLLRWVRAGGHGSEKAVLKIRDFARFLRRNQLPTGWVPARFGDDLVPIRGEDGGDPRDALACGRFLANFAAYSGTPTDRKRAGRILEAVLAAGTRSTAQPRNVGSTGARMPASLVTPRLSAVQALDGLALSLGLGSRGTRFAAALFPLIRAWHPLWETAPLPPLLLATNEGRPPGPPAPGGEAAFLLARAWMAGAPFSWAERAAWLARHASEPADGSWLEGLRREIGEVLVDPALGKAVAFGPWKVSLEAGTRNLRLEGGRKNPRKLRIRARLPEGSSTARPWSVNGALVETRTDPKGFLVFEARPLPGLRIRFRPPSLHDHRVDLDLEADLEGFEGSEPLEVRFEVSGEGTGRLVFPAHLSQGRAHGARRARILIPAGRLPASGDLVVALTARQGTRTLRDPPQGGHRIRLGTVREADCGDDAETWLLDAGASRVVPAADGRGRARVTPPSGSFRYRIPVPASAIRLRIDLRVQGNGLLEAGGSRFRLRSEEERGFADVLLELANREDWERGRLELVFHGTSTRESGLVRIRWEALGEAAPPSEIGRKKMAETRTPPVLDLRIRPRFLGGSPPATIEACRRFLFGEGDVGRRSLASTIRDWSRGRLLLRGRISAWEPLSKRPDPIPRGEGEAGALETILWGGPGPCPLRSGASLLLEGPPGAERVRRWAEALLARFEDPPWPSEEEILEDPPSGGPADLPRSPRPPALRFFRLGWREAREVPPIPRNKLALPASPNRPTLCLLPEPPFPGRGSLSLETRGPGAPPLVLRDLGRNDTLALPGGEAPRLLRYRPGARWLSPQGEEFWTGKVHPSPPGSETLVLSLTPRFRTDLAARAEISTRLGAGGTWVPRQVEEGGSGGASPKRDTGLGDLRLQGGALSGSLPKQPGSALRLRIRDELWSGGARLLLRAASTTGCISFRLQGNEGRFWSLDSVNGPVADILTLPPRSAGPGKVPVWTLDLVSASGGGERFEGLSLTLAGTSPLVLDLMDLAPPGSLVDHSPVLADGFRYGPVLKLPTTREEGRALSLPLTVPRNGGLLRIRAGRADPRRAEDTNLRLRFLPTGGGKARVLCGRGPLRRAGGPWITYRIPLGDLAGASGFLLCESSGPAGETWILDASIRED